jgi:outer membrane protein assembly factor BamB
MASDTVIELDVDPAAESPPEAGLPPTWRRAFAAACVLVACVASLVAGAPLQPPRLVPVAMLDTPPLLSERVLDDTMYAIVSTGTPTLTSYRLSDGRQGWSVPLPVSDSAASVEIGTPSTILVNSLDPTSRQDRTAAVDAATGMVLWHSTSYRITPVVVGRTALLADNLPTATGSGRRYRMVDVRTGRQLWTYDVAGGWTTVLPGDPDGTGRHLVVVSPSGAARSVDLATGRQVAAADVQVGSSGIDEADHQLAGPLMDRDQALPAGPSLMLRDDVLLVGYEQDGRSLLAGYRTDRLTPLWTTEVQSLNLRVDECGALLCLGESGDVRAIRTDNGAVVWSGVDWPGVVGVLGRWVYTVSDLAVSYGYWPGPARLVDPGTGRTTLNLGSWRLVSEPDRVGDLALFEYTEQSTGKVWLGALSGPGTGPHVEPLGTVVDPPSGTCDAGPAHIVCLTAADQVRIWRYRA